MISRLPRWIWAGAWVLAFIAGIVNVVGLLGFEHQAVSHLTGNTSLLGQALAEGDIAQVLHFLATIVAFMAGTVLSGFIVRDSALQLGRRYGVALLLESVLLLAAVPLLLAQSRYGMYAAACACGLQNGMASTFSGAIVRTTHVSGMFTDLGLFIGHALRGLPVDWRRAWVCLVVISGFLCGGVAGTLGFGALGFPVLLFPAGLIVLVALAYGLYSVRRPPSP